MTRQPAQKLRIELHEDAGQWRAELWVDREKDCYAKAWAYSRNEAFAALIPYLHTVASEDLDLRVAAP